MREQMSAYFARTATQVAEQQAKALEVNPFEEEQSAEWARIIAGLIFIISLVLMPTFFVD